MHLRSVLVILAIFIAVCVTAILFLAFTIDRPLAGQETSKIEVRLVELKPTDQWLEKVHFQVIPLDGVKGRHKYAIVVATPPPGRIQINTYSKAVLVLTASTYYWTPAAHTPGYHSFPEEIQPIIIKSEDFGLKGDQVAVKFIDEGVRTNETYYQQSQHLLIGSSLDQ